MNIVEIIHELEKVAPVYIKATNPGYAAGFGGDVWLWDEGVLRRLPVGRGATETEAIQDFWALITRVPDRVHLVVNPTTYDERKAFRVDRHHFEEFEEFPVPAWKADDIHAGLEIWYTDTNGERQTRVVYIGTGSYMDHFILTKATTHQITYGMDKYVSAIQMAQFLCEIKARRV